MSSRSIGLIVGLTVGLFGGSEFACWNASADDPNKPASKPEPAKTAEQQPAQKSDPAEKTKPKETPKAGEPAKPAGPNPLQNLIQRLIQPRGALPPANPQPPNTNARPTDPDARDHIDSRTPKDRRQAEQFRKAAAAAESKDWPSVIDLLQNILSQEEDSVDRFGKEGYGSLRERAMRLMLKLPPDVIQTFQQRFANDAQRMLDEALRSGRTEKLAVVAARFLVLEAGQVAADRLGTRHLDRGEVSRAMFWFRLLSEANAELTRDRRWQLKAAMTARRAADTEWAERWLKGDGSHGENETIDLSNQSVRVRDWLARFEKQLPTLRQLHEWLMLFGSASRSGTLPGGEPLLLPRWTHPLTQLQPLQRQIEMLMEDCHDQQRATVMVAQPLLVNGRVAVRTLGGVQVFDLDRGRPLWTSAERWPVEELIGTQSGQYVTRRVIGPGGVVIQNMQLATSYEFSGMGLDQNPLAQLFFSHGNFGQLSSDGRQLFAIEDDTFAAQNIGYWGNNDLSRQDPLRRSWSSNKLVSYDLQSGRPLWAVGGVDSEEAFRPELPGVFFFGAPVREGEDLFVIGERDAEIRLFCLDALTGKPLWTQLLATAELGISRDFWRRSFAAQVALSDGVIVCPTTVGWLVGVDRATHQLLWLHRYSNPVPNNQRRNQNQAMTVQTSWGQRWAPSAPMIFGDSVVYAAQEFSDEVSNRSGQLVCLKLQTGERRWNPKPKDSWVAVNGVANGKVLLIGSNTVSAVSLDDGNVPWTVTINSTDGVPSGLGVISSDRWHLPLSSGQLWTISLKNGEVVSKQFGAQATRLGNLALYRGAFLSLHPTGLTCFEQRESIAEQIRQRQEKNSADPWTFITNAAIAQLERRPEIALAELRKTTESAVSAEQQSRYRNMLRDTLATLIETAPQQHAAELDQLKDLIQSSDDRLRWQRLKVTELRERGEQQDAFDLLLELSQGDVSVMVPLTASPARSVRLSAWLAGQLADLWNSIPAEKRPAIDQRLKERIPQLFARGGESRRTALTIFGFHPIAQELRWKEIDEWLTQKEFSRAEMALIDLGSSERPEVAARAWQRLIELQQFIGLPLDAAIAARQLSQWNETVLPGGTTAKQWVTQQITDGKLAAAPTTSIPDWSNFEFRIERSFGYHNYSEQSFECLVPDARWPFFATERFQYQHVNSPVQAQRLLATGLTNNQLNWSLPLRFKGNAPITNGVLVRTVGHQMLVLHRDVLHLLSPVDRRVLWTRPIDLRTTTYFDANQSLRRQSQPIMSGNDLLSRLFDVMDDTGRGSLVVLCSPRIIVYRGRRVLTALDANSGETLWTANDIPTDARLVATHDVIHITSRTTNTGLLLRTHDGHLLPTDETVQAQFGKAKASLGADLLLVSRDDNSTSKLIVERWNPLRRRSNWKQTFATNDLFQWLDSQSLLNVSLAVPTEMTLQTLDAETGQLRSLGTLKNADFAGSIQQRFAIADRDRVFLILTGNRTSFYGDEFVSIPINGSIVAFDRHAGGELWREKINNHGLVIQQFASCPVLLFTTRRFEQKGRFSQQLASVLLLDKKTGRKLLEDTFPNQYGGYRSLTLNLAERQLELLTYNERIRLVGDLRNAEKTAETGR